MVYSDLFFCCCCHFGLYFDGPFQPTTCFQLFQMILPCSYLEDDQKGTKKVKEERHKNNKEVLTRLLTIMSIINAIVDQKRQTINLGVGENWQGK